MMAMSIHVFCIVICSVLTSIIAIFCRTAYDVAINDDSWPKEAFELVSGEVSKTLERLEP